MGTIPPTRRVRYRTEGRTGRAPISQRGGSVKFPKASAAFDELLAKQVKEYGEDLIAFAIASLSAPPVEPVKPTEEAKKDGS